MRKITIITAIGLCGLAAAVAPATARELPEGITIDENGVTIDTGIRCVTEPCPSHITIPFPG